MSATERDSQPSTQATLSAVRPFYWSVRREIWENRSLWIAPLVVAGVVLFGFLLSLPGLPARRRALLALDPASQAAAVAHAYDLAAVAIILTTVVVAIAYCLGALHGERRDRSILFWKSLPVSDLTTVLAKAAVPLVVLPAIAVVVVVVLQLVMLIVSAAVLAASGLNEPTAAHAPLLAMTAVLLYGLVTFALWWAPLYAWLLLVSAWARRAPFLWAVLPPVALCLIERIAFGGSHLASLLGDRLIGGYAQAFDFAPHVATLRPGLATTGLSQIDALKFLTSPGLWGGLVVAATLLAATVWLRHRRPPI